MSRSTHLTKMSNSVTKETMMAYNSGVSNSMTGQDGGVVGQGVGHHWGVDSVSHSRGVVGGGGGVVFWVLGLAVVGHISNISVVIIGVVVDVLDSAIGKSNGVRSLGVTGTVGRLGSIEVVDLVPVIFHPWKVMCFMAVELWFGLSGSRYLPRQGGSS